MSIFEALFVLLFLAAVFFNFRSPKVPFYCLLGFVTAVYTPTYAIDAQGHFLGTSGMMFTVALILWNWANDLKAAVKSRGVSRDQINL